MDENKSNIESIKRKEWNPPDLFQLDFRRTSGGTSVANYEDKYNNNPTSETN
jgi:hypothetical protein